MHAFLVVGSTPEHRQQVAERLLVDHGSRLRPELCYELVGLPENSRQIPAITISQVRALKGWVALNDDRRRATLVRDAQKLTPEAQHALLKTLEEPETPVLFILTADSELSLLPTLCSRCKIVRLNSPGNLTFLSGLLARLPKPEAAPGQKILWLYQELSSFEGTAVSPHRGAIPLPRALEFIQSLVHTVRHSFQSTTARPNDGKRLALLLLLAVQAHRRLKHHLNPSLVLEQLAIDL